MIARIAGSHTPPPSRPPRLVRALPWVVAAVLPLLLVGTALTLSTLSSAFKHAAPDTPEPGAPGGTPPLPPRSVATPAQVLRPLRVVVLLSSEGATESYECLSIVETLATGAQWAGRSIELWSVQADFETPRVLPLTGQLGIAPVASLAHPDLPIASADLLVLPSHTRPLGPRALAWLATDALRVPLWLAPGEGMRHVISALGAPPGAAPRANPGANLMGAWTGHALWDATRGVDAPWRALWKPDLGLAALTWSQGPGRESATQQPVVISSGGGLWAVRAAELATQLAIAPSRQPRTPPSLDAIARPRPLPWAAAQLQNADRLRLLAAASLDWYTPTIALVLADGISELELAAELAPSARTLSRYVTTVAERRRYVRSLHGLWLVPNEAVLYGAYYPDAIVRVASLPAWSELPSSVRAWGETRTSTRRIELEPRPGPPSLRATRLLRDSLERLANDDGAAWDPLVARLLDSTDAASPPDRYDLHPSEWLGYLGKVVGLALAGMAVLWLFQRRSSRLVRK